MSELTNFLNATRRCLNQCQTMLEFEQEKRQALLADDMDRLESMLQSQQAAIMQLESLEKQRLKAQEEAGYKDLSAEEVLEELAPGPEKTELTQYITELRQALRDIRFHNEKSLDITRNNLRILATVASGSNPEGKKEQVVYGRSQGKESTWSGGSSFEKKI